MGAFVDAWSVGNSSGEDEGRFGRVSIGGALVKRTDLVVCAVGGAIVASFGKVVFEEKNLKKASWISLKPSVRLKFCSVQKQLYVVVKLLKAVRPLGVVVFGFELVSRLNMKVVAMFHPLLSKFTSVQCQALRMVSSISVDSCPVWGQDMDLKMPRYTSYHFLM